ncbi:MAG TPA: PQQ-dependent sugar dehydrogenase [Anaerolineae bacterium]|nr:PQQ-dependent sugar dehydrogenase [Anaerolineae bacterium]
MKQPVALYLLLTTLLISCSTPNNQQRPTTTPPPITISATTPPPTQPPATPTPDDNPPTTTSSLTNTPTPTSSTTPTPTALPTTPPTIPPATIEIPGASLPPGFSLIKFADIFRPTSLAFDNQGRLYATSFNPDTGDGEIHIFIDSDNDGRADTHSRFHRGLTTPLGIEIHPTNGDIYVSSSGRIDILYDLDNDLVADDVETFVTDLPFGLHQNNNLKFGPDNQLYIGIGSTCDACFENDLRSATIMRFDPLTGYGQIIATGLRNPYDLAFHPQSGHLFATDNGRDDLGLDAPHEELNHIKKSHDYGWPDCWGDGQGDCADTTLAITLFTPHSSANSLDFYPNAGPFPNQYHHNLFVAILGSWLTELPRGIQRVILTPHGDEYTTTHEWFARWDGRPLGLIVGPDNALYVGDYQNGGIYRISYGP